MSRGQSRLYAQIESLADKSRWSLNGGPFGSKLVSSMYVDEGVPVIRGANMGDGSRFKDSDFVFVTTEKADGLRAHTAKRGDVVFTQRGTLGQVALIPHSSRFDRYVISQSQMKLTVDPIKANAAFVYYCFCDPNIRSDFIALASSSGVPHVNLATLREFSIPIPPLPVQRRIADILTAYDDLIENNTRRIAILEDMARRLFEAWFLADAKAGRWVDLETLCEGKTGIQTGPFGSQLHKQDYSDDGVPVVMPKNMADLKIREEGIARIPPELAATMPRHILRDGDIVYGRRGDIGRRAFVTHREDGWFCGTGCLRIRPDKGKISPRYLFDALGLPETDGAIKGRAHGATMPNLSAGLMKSVPMFLPEKDVQERYAGLVDPLFELAASLEACTTTLRTTRDLLLPKLISGEIEVRAAEQALEAVAA